LASALPNPDKQVLLPQIWSSQRWLVPLFGLFLPLILVTFFSLGEIGFESQLPNRGIDNLALVAEPVKLETQSILDKVYGPLWSDLGSSFNQVEEIGKGPSYLAAETLALQDNFYLYLKEEAGRIINQSTNSWTEIFEKMGKLRKLISLEFYNFGLAWTQSIEIVRARLSSDGLRLAEDGEKNLVRLRTLSGQLASYPAHLVAQIPVGLSRISLLTENWLGFLPRSLMVFSYSLSQSGLEWSQALTSFGQSYNQGLYKLVSETSAWLKNTGSFLNQGRLSLREKIVFSTQGVWSSMSEYQTKAVANWKNFLGTDGAVTLESLPPELREQIRQEIEAEVKKNLGGAASAEPGSLALPQEGVVVVPSSSSSSDEALRKKIQGLFSDQVEVKFDKSGKTGIITPVFKEGPGGNYIFMMTPINK